MLQRGQQVVERLPVSLSFKKFLKVGASDKLVQETRQDEDLVLAQLSPRHTDGAYGRMSFHDMCGLSGVSLWVQTVARAVDATRLLSRISSCLTEHREAARCVGSAQVGANPRSRLLPRELDRHWVADAS